MGFASVATGQVGQSFLLLSWPIDCAVSGRSSFCTQIFPRLPEDPPVPLGSLALIYMGNVQPSHPRLPSPYINPGLWLQSFCCHSFSFLTASPKHDTCPSCGVLQFTTAWCAAVPHDLDKAVTCGLKVARDLWDGVTVWGCSNSC